VSASSDVLISHENLLQVSVVSCNRIGFAVRQAPGLFDLANKIVLFGISDIGYLSYLEHEDVNEFPSPRSQADRQPDPAHP
jgi:hypothetical protein